MPPLQWYSGAAVVVVLAAQGYPDAPRTGDIIDGLESAAQVADTAILHAGTRWNGEEFVSAGGRVLGVVGTGDNLVDARARAYEALSRVTLPGAHFRTDIAAAATAGESR